MNSRTLLTFPYIFQLNQVYDSTKSLVPTVVEHSPEPYIKFLATLKLTNEKEASELESLIQKNLGKTIAFS